MRVLIPSSLRSYTKRMWVEANGATLRDVLADLERQFPGIRFRMIDEQDRMRANMRFFVGGTPTFDLERALRAGDELHIVQALSGG
jgi:sulfur-carrier protein